MTSRPTRPWQRHRPPPVTTVREAMAILRDASTTELSAALSTTPEASSHAADTPLPAALAILRRWFDDLPPDRTEPAMTFPEFARLLHQALTHP